MPAEAPPSRRFGRGPGLGLLLGASLLWPGSASALTWKPPPLELSGPGGTVKVTAFQRCDPPGNRAKPRCHPRRHGRIPFSKPPLPARPGDRIKVSFGAGAGGIGFGFPVGLEPPGRFQGLGEPPASRCYCYGFFRFPRFQKSYRQKTVGLLIIPTYRAAYGQSPAPGAPPDSAFAFFEVGFRRR